MTSSSRPLDSATDATTREQIDALLDEALKESFPASDSIAIGSGTTAIKQNHRDRVAASKESPKADAEVRNVADGIANAGDTTA